MLPLRIASPAKLNLFLHITGQRDDGYHLLQTIFQLIDLCDELIFSASNSDQLHIEGMPELSIADNLIFRAMSALHPYRQTQQGISIRLIKRIPAGAGLGGGSSNAATTLLVLNQLWQCGLSMSQLMSLGQSLGADVPVFVLGQNAWAEGIGEQLTPVLLPKTDYIVLKPDCFISTKQLFLQESLTKNTVKTTFAAYQQNPEQFANNFAAVATRLYPPVAQAMAYLQQFGSACLTGTGACVFMPVQSTHDVAAILQQAPCEGFFCRGLAQSPVHQQLGLPQA